MPATFEFSKAVKEIEEINNWFQQEEIDLQEAIEKYKRGMELISACKGQLSEFTNKITEIRTNFASAQE